MKLAIAAFGTALVLATSASAMIGPYERAVEDPAAATHLFTTGNDTVDQTASVSNSPESDWTGDDIKKVTVFSTNAPAQLGADAR
ncbi:hypothetical protein RXV86_09440 [Alisedimentitalea sp. MJ-SS2]|uniref:hypothetical protein n=1 Tax=Aliisedimentitalea sp. MJ-SS2 TaxID=3049795 RepID=UPI002915036B|nr:hypothetical protein [Alisedimentitalea sp. MJ-SS2]MDU8927606.1 hypothetical protein [Alisedimentitalea sp. MJ-SS2]